MQRRRSLIAAAAAAMLVSGAVWALAAWFSNPCPPVVRVVPEDLAVATGRVVRLRVTGYCSCGACCGWRRSWFGFGPPVCSYGAEKGRPKRVGLTASGRMAGWGTVAADLRVLPLGTLLYVPGYGPARVDDVGGGVKGEHIDLWFPSHAQALAWGSRRLQVAVGKSAGGRLAVRGKGASR